MHLYVQYIYKLTMISQNQLLQIHKFFMCFELQAHFTFCHDPHGGNGPDKPKVMECIFQRLTLAMLTGLSHCRQVDFPAGQAMFESFAQWAKAQARGLPTKGKFL